MKIDLKLNNRRLFLVVIFVITLIMGFQIIQARYLPAGAQAEQRSKYNSKTDKVINPSRRDLTEKLTLAGSIDAASRSDVRFQTSGLLSWVGVKVGDRVKKWQALASLDRRELKKRLDQQFNDYRTSLHNFNDTNDKYQPQRDALVLTDEMKRILDRSQFSLNNSVIDYELADLSIKYATIVSPINGIVVTVEQPVAGVNITPATSSITVIDPGSIYFKSTIDEEEVRKINVGQETEIVLDSLPDRPIKSKITYISFTPVAGETNTVYEIRYDLTSLNNTDLTYKLGMSGDANIITGLAQQVITIPLDALVEDNGQTYVWLKQDKDLVSRNVKTGLANDSEIEIVAGLSETDTIVIRGR